MDPITVQLTQAEWLNLGLGLLNTALLVVGTSLAVRSIRQATRQRYIESFRTMLDEYHDEVLAVRAPLIDRKFPIFEGDLEQRLQSFITHSTSKLGQEDLKAAEEVIYKLNALGSLMERGAVLETHFFEYAFPRIVTLISRLEPYILIRSAVADQRWGMRVRRMLAGAVLCYRLSPLYNDRDCKADGVVLVAASTPTRRERLGMWIRKARRRPAYLRPASEVRDIDRADLAVAARVVAGWEGKDLRFLMQTRST
jgi:hypothetical protein